MTHVLLLVDDDANLLHGLARALRGQPYQIYTAKGAEEAMWVLKGRSVDVIVTDEKMPGMPGTKLLAWVADHYPEVMRIMLTGHASLETAVRAVNEGSVYRIFLKPCREADLAIAIRKALEKSEEVRKNRQLPE
jgi:two-component system probable response regulator PhcQ